MATQEVASHACSPTWVTQVCGAPCDQKMRSLVDEHHDNLGNLENTSIKFCCASSGKTERADVIKRTSDIGVVHVRNSPEHVPHHIGSPQWSWDTMAWQMERTKPVSCARWQLKNWFAKRKPTRAFIYTLFSQVFWLNTACQGQKGIHHIMQ